MDTDLWVLPSLPASRLFLYGTTGIDGFSFTWAVPIAAE